MTEHFALPFRLGTDSQVVVVEQDSDAEIEASVIVILRSRLGYRDDRPEFGIADPTFRQGGADLEALREAVAEFEPRADLLFDREPALLEGLVDRVLIRPNEATE